MPARLDHAEKTDQIGAIQKFGMGQGLFKRLIPGGRLPIHFYAQAAICQASIHNGAGQCF
jgi:hypothetical protein